MVIVDGRVELVFFVRYSSSRLSIHVGAFLVAGWLVSLSAFALARGRVQVGRARVWVGIVAWFHFCFLSSIWLFRTSEPVISVVSNGHFQIRALELRHQRTTPLERAEKELLLTKILE